MYANHSTSKRRRAAEATPLVPEAGADARSIHARQVVSVTLVDLVLMTVVDSVVVTLLEFLHVLQLQ